METAEGCVLANMTFEALPENIRAALGYSRDRWSAKIRDVSLDHGLRWKDGIIREVMKEGEYYIQLLTVLQAQMKVTIRLLIANCNAISTYLQFASLPLQLYPYHMIDEILQFTKISDFQYYIDMLDNMIKQGAPTSSFQFFQPSSNCSHSAQRSHMILFRTSLPVTAHD